MCNLYVVLYNGKDPTRFSKFRELGLDITRKLHEAGHNQRNLCFECVEPGDGSCTCSWKYLGKEIADLTNEPEKKALSLLRLWDTNQWNEPNKRLNVNHLYTHIKKQNASKTYRLIKSLVEQRFGNPIEENEPLGRFRYRQFC
ncbi:MAG: hypothetical protein AABX94_02875 [Nanoarchaeota archaeon]